MQLPMETAAYVARLEADHIETLSGLRTARTLLLIFNTLFCRMHGYTDDNNS